MTWADVRSRGRRLRGRLTRPGLGDQAWRLAGVFEDAHRRGDRTAVVEPGRWRLREVVVIELARSRGYELHAPGGPDGWVLREPLRFTRAGAR